ncbi:MAG TPA: glutamine synthetase III [Planctomycetota bacterium]|nr:glutamine synthetase III [Planctomycetota bacterium]
MPQASRLTDHFGSKVFNDSVQRRRLPRETYQALRRTLDTGHELPPDVADAVASAMKDWAVEHGATHYTHWFQPMHGLTAEKHDAFLSPTLEGGAIQEFSGKQLILGEPDASSFPSGGLRNTFEARGYTGWDPGSPAFLRETEYGCVLVIPTVFASWTGDALDTKTPLLRSCEALDREARALLALVGDRDVRRVIATVGPEQEYFLVDAALYDLRPDLIACGRSLLGAQPPKGQELEDHYFGQTPKRILNFQMDVEAELWALGVPVKTRHNEVAPHQFEMAPFFEAAQLATDHNMLAMEVLEEVALRHGLRCLLHEKPFAGVNGSGKHTNWSMATDQGTNLLEPGHTPHDNLRFILFLAAVVRAVDLHQDLLRAAIAHAGNDHRLGANEAPPAIISIFLGEELQGVVEALITSKSPRPSQSGEKLKLGVTTLPPLPRDTSDRNRTSPFAFTGQKFEFRAVGSSQTIAFPVMVLNTIAAESLRHVTSRLEAAAKGGAPDLATTQQVVREILTEHQRILFSGDNYSHEWKQEAKRRGLLDLPDTPSALARFATQANIELFERHGVLTRRETESRSAILVRSYVERVRVEALSLLGLAATSVLPAGLKHQRAIADSINAARAAHAKVDLGDQEELLAEVAATANRLKRSIDALREVEEALEAHEGLEAAKRTRAELVPAMDEVRTHCDRLEELVDDELWPLPKYREILFAH